MDKLISVVVPIYNVEKYLNKCVCSIVNQTYKNIEIILVDDGSKDNSGDIANEWCKKDKRIKVYHKANGGLSDARNYGIEQANGDYITFIDSDDYIDKNFLLYLYECMNKYCSDISICGRYSVYENGMKKCKYNEVFDKKYDFISAIREMNKFYYFDMSACTKLYKIELFKDIRFPKGKLSEDYFVMYKLFKKAKSISYTSKPLYFYLQRQNSISNNKNINEDFIEAARQQMIDLENSDEKLKTIVHVAYASSFLTVADFYIKQKVKFPKSKYKKFKKEIYLNKKYIKGNKDISLNKKIQFKLFLFNFNFYKFEFSVYKKIN